jgi:hypothetical protein
MGLQLVAPFAREVFIAELIKSAVSDGVEVTEELKKRLRVYGCPLVYES